MANQFFCFRYTLRPVCLSSTSFRLSQRLQRIENILGSLFKQALVTKPAMSSSLRAHVSLYYY